MLKQSKLFFDLFLPCQNYICKTTCNFFQFSASNFPGSVWWRMKCLHKTFFFSRYLSIVYLFLWFNEVTSEVLKRSFLFLFWVWIFTMFFFLSAKATHEKRQMIKRNINGKVLQSYFFSWVGIVHLLRISRAPMLISFPILWYFLARVFFFSLLQKKKFT